MPKRYSNRHANQFILANWKAATAGTEIETAFGRTIPILKVSSDAEGSPDRHPEPNTSTQFGRRNAVGFAKRQRKTETVLAGSDCREMGPRGTETDCRK